MYGYGCIVCFLYFVVYPIQFSWLKQLKTKVKSQCFLYPISETWIEFWFARSTPASPETLWSLMCALSLIKHPCSCSCRNTAYQVWIWAFEVCSFLFCFVANISVLYTINFIYTCSNNSSRRRRCLRRTASSILFASPLRLGLAQNSIMPKGASALSTIHLNWASFVYFSKYFQKIWGHAAL